MSNRERAHSRSSGGIRDIGLFVENYKSLWDKLFPVFAVWDIVLYVARWENYSLTLAVILTFSILFYFPTILFSLLTLAAILIMAAGRYHGQTKAIIALRKPPPVELLDPDQYALKKQHSEQGHMHKSRLEFRQILSNAETFIINASKLVDYLYSVYLWKSPEVSLCVTVLLCVLLVLLCTVDLHSIGAAIPVIVLCTNKYFFSRSIDLWKQLLTRLKQRLERKREVSQPSKSSDHSSLDEQEREEEEERDTAPVEPGTTQHSVEQDHNHVTGGSESMAPELRHRGGDSQVSTEQTSVGAGGGGENVRSEESAVLEAGLGIPQSTRKDSKSPQLELCSKCQTSFFLKRKHDCSICGQTFCGSCTVKVKRAALGATSPAAFEGSVRVCLNCKAQLTITKE